MTAFHTCYSLFEWLITSFRLVNALATFQKFINWSLHEYLDDFIFMYMNNIFIFITGFLRKHRKHVYKILVKMQIADLQIDVDKCEFKIKFCKYLDFIIEAGKDV